MRASLSSADLGLKTDSTLSPQCSEATPVNSRPRYLDYRYDSELSQGLVCTPASDLLDSVNTSRFVPWTLGNIVRIFFDSQLTKWRDALLVNCRPDDGRYLAEFLTPMTSNKLRRGSKEDEPLEVEWVDLSAFYTLEFADCVWARVSSYPWWPGIVAFERDIGGQFVSRGNRITVCFPTTKHVSLVQLEFVRPFSTFYSQIAPEVRGNRRCANAILETLKLHRAMENRRAQFAERSAQLVSSLEVFCTPFQFVWFFPSL
jgi:hypothetical protein